MTELMFTDDELALFQKCFEKNKSWLQWVRVVNRDGLDILSLDISDKVQKTVRMTKKEGRGYLAKSVGEWGVETARDFQSLLDKIPEMR